MLLLFSTKPLPIKQSIRFDGGYTASQPAVPVSSCHTHHAAGIEVMDVANRNAYCFFEEKVT